MKTGQLILLDDFDPIDNLEEVERDKFDRKREKMLFDIYCASAQWEKIGDEVYNGSGFSITLGEETISGKLTFDLYNIEVEMTYPAQLTLKRNIVFHSRFSYASVSLTKNGEKDGPATDKCMQEAVKTLMEMYNDWKEIRSRRETILEKFRLMPEKEREYMERETARCAPLKEKELMLAHLSGEVKKCFKAGLFNQKEYVPIKHTLHDKIVALQLEAHTPDFFRMYFEEELASCTALRLNAEVLKKLAEA